MQNRLVLLGLTDQKRDVSEQGLINCQRPTAVENVQASHYHIYLFFVSSNHLSLSNQSRTRDAESEMCSFIGTQGYVVFKRTQQYYFLSYTNAFCFYVLITYFKNIYYAYNFNREKSVSWQHARRNLNFFFQSMRFLRLKLSLRSSIHKILTES